MLKLLLFIVTPIALVSPCEAQVKWKWSDDHASIMYYLMRASNNYEVQIVRGVMSDAWDLEVRIANGAETVHRWQTHPESAFLIKDKIVIYANFSMISSGCELRAYDLEKREEIWRSRLDGLGPVDHSKYRNRINMELRNDRVVVFGNESSGQYIESRDIKTGELIAHIVGTGEYRRFVEQ